MRESPTSSSTSSSTISIGEIRLRKNPKLCLKAPTSSSTASSRYSPSRRQLISAPCGALTQVWRFDSADGLLRLNAFPWLCVGVERAGPPRNYVRLIMKNCGDGSSSGNNSINNRSSSNNNSINNSINNRMTDASVLRFASGRLTRCGIRGKRKRGYFFSP